MPFRGVFIAVVIAAGLVVAAYMINYYRPRVVTEQPTAETKGGFTPSQSMHSQTG